jgi:ABC-2 type transport system permease protein
MNFLTVLRKELLEQWRTYRFLIVAAVMVLFGLISPLLAKLTPELLKSIPDLPPGLAATIPVPTLADAVGQYLKNMSQFGILLALLVSMGVVVQEKERGTAAMMLTRQVSRETFVLAKFVGLALSFSAALLFAAIGCWYYTYFLFGRMAWGPWLGLNALMLLVFLVYTAAALLCSTLARTQSAAAGLALGALILIAGVGALPRLNEYLPGRLFGWGGSLILGVNDPSWGAVWVSLGMVVVFLAAAILIFRRQEF